MFYSEKKFSSEIHDKYNIESMNRRKTIAGSAFPYNQKQMRYSENLKDNLNLTSWINTKREKDFYNTEANNTDIYINNINSHDFSFKKLKDQNLTSPTKSTKNINHSYSRSRSKSKPRTLKKNDFKNIKKGDEIFNEDDGMSDLKKNIFKDYKEDIIKSSEKLTSSFRNNIIPISELSESSRRESLNHIYHK